MSGMMTRDTDITAVVDSLFGVTDGRTLHRSFHRARAASRANVQRTQPQLVSDLLGVIVFFPAYRMTTPADYKVRSARRLQDSRISQDVENRIAYVGRRPQVKAAAFVQFVVGINDIAKHGEQQFANAANHLAVDESGRRRAFQGYLQPAVLLQESDFEVLVFLQYCPRIIQVGTGVQYRQDGAPQYLVQPTFAMLSKLLHLDL
jgi:hypothetical protein